MRAAIFPSRRRWRVSVCRCRSTRGSRTRSSKRSRRRCGSSSLPDRPSNEAPNRLIADVDFGEGVVVQAFTNLYGCRIGDETRIGTFVEIQRGAVIGSRCKIQSHSFICDGVTIEDEVFVGHGVMFINDKFPAATTETGALKSDDDWELERTVVEKRASIGSGAGVRGGFRIPARAVVGAGGG